jgi:hypothetical protein
MEVCSTGAVLQQLCRSCQCILEDVAGRRIAYNVLHCTPAVVPPLLLLVLLLLLLLMQGKASHPQSEQLKQQLAAAAAAVQQMQQEMPGGRMWGHC